jgi:hypothetical protein
VRDIPIRARCLHRQRQRREGFDRVSRNDIASSSSRHAGDNASAKNT